MFEAEVKSNIVRVANLEQELKVEKNERIRIETEFQLVKDNLLFCYSDVFESQETENTRLNQMCQTLFP